MTGRRLLVAVVGATMALALVSPVARAQDDTPGANLGGYIGQAQAMAFSFQPVFPALLPTGDAPIEATVALSTASVKSGGNAFGRAAIVWPGSAASDPGPLIGAGFGEEEIGNLFPKWPLQAQATQNDGEVTTGLPPGIVMRATGFPDRAGGDSRVADVDVPGLISIGHVASTSSSVVTDSDVTSLGRVALEGVSLLGGHITVEQIRSFSRTTSTGSSATHAGDVDIVGMKIGGINVSVTDDGFQVTGLPPGSEQAPGAGDEPFPNQSPEEQVQQILAFLGARITLFDSNGSGSGGVAQRLGTGFILSVDNPVGGKDRIPPGHFDLILAATSASTQASPPFVFEVPDVGTGGGLGGASGQGTSASIGEGPRVAGETVARLDRLASATGPESLPTGPGTVGGALPASSDYQFGGVPITLVVVLLIASAVVARYIRRFFTVIMSSKG